MAMPEVEGKPLPHLTLTDWRGASGMDDFRGKILVIDFWATWCHPCLAVIPKFNRLMGEYRDREVAVLGICATTGSETMEQVVQDKGILYPVARDVDKGSEYALRVRWFPYHILVDRRGIVRGAGVRFEKLEQDIEQMLSE